MEKIQEFTSNPCSKEELLCALVSNQLVSAENSQEALDEDGGAGIKYYYYQDSEGRHLYLHPLDIRLLKHEFQSYSKFPDLLSVSIADVELVVMNMVPFATSTDVNNARKRGNDSNI